MCKKNNRILRIVTLREMSSVTSLTISMSYKGQTIEEDSKETKKGASRIDRAFIKLSSKLMIARVKIFEYCEVCKQQYLYNVIFLIIKH